VTPDTIVVISQAPTTTGADWTVILSGLGAAVIVGAIAGWTTWVQRGMARKTIDTQRQLADSSAQTQRTISDKQFETQLEIARRASVVQSRQEWARELRSAVGSFESVATSLTLSAGKPARPEAIDARKANLAAISQWQAVIRLFLDLRKPDHVEITRTLSAIWEFAVFPDAVEAERNSKEPGTGDFLDARKYANIGEAFGALNAKVSAVLEAAWQKVKAGE
jgi:hypothetical protein